MSMGTDEPGRMVPKVLKAVPDRTAASVIVVPLWLTTVPVSRPLTTLRWASRAPGIDSAYSSPKAWIESAFGHVMRAVGGLPSVMVSEPALPEGVENGWGMAKPPPRKSSLPPDRVVTRDPLTVLTAGGPAWGWETPAPALS